MPIRASWRKVRAWFVHLLHLDESAHGIALGAAIGVFIALTPTLGMQMLLIFFVTSLVRASRVAGVPMAWITNPATIVPIYSFNYMVGRALVGGPKAHTPARFEEALEAVADPGLAWWVMVKEWWDLVMRVAVPLWVGSVVVGVAAGGATYALMYYLINFYRTVHRHRLAKAAAARAGPVAMASGADPDEPPREEPGEPREHE